MYILEENKKELTNFRISDLKIKLFNRRMTVKIFQNRLKFAFIILSCFFVKKLA